MFGATDLKMQRLLSASKSTTNDAMSQSLRRIPTTSAIPVLTLSNYVMRTRTRARMGLTGALRAFAASSTWREMRRHAINWSCLASRWQHRDSTILTSQVYLISLLCTTVANASASSCITIFDTSFPEAPGISLSPTQSSAIMTSYPKRAASRAVVDTQTCA